MYEKQGDDLLAALRGFDPNFLLIGNIPIGEFILCITRLQDKIDELENDIKGYKYRTW